MGGPLGRSSKLGWGPPWGGGKRKRKRKRGRTEIGERRKEKRGRRQEKGGKEKISFNHQKLVIITGAGEMDSLFPVKASA